MQFTTCVFGLAQSFKFQKMKVYEAKLFTNLQRNFCLVFFFRSKQNVTQNGYKKPINFINMFIFLLCKCCSVEGCSVVLTGTAGMQPC